MFAKSKVSSSALQALEIPLIELNDWANVVEKLNKKPKNGGK